MRSVKMEDLIGKLQEKHPDKDIKLLKAIVREGFYMMNQYIIKNHEVEIHVPRKKVKMTIYKPRRVPWFTRTNPRHDAE